MAQFSDVVGTGTEQLLAGVAAAVILLGIRHLRLVRPLTGAAMNPPGVFAAAVAVFCGGAQQQEWYTGG